MIKKFISSLLVAAVLLLNVGVPLVHAQETFWFNQGFDEWYTKVYDPETADEIFGERYTAAQVWWVIYGFAAFIMNGMGDSEVFSCVIAHMDSDTFEGDCREIVETALQQFRNDDTSSSGLLDTIATSPVSSVAYFKDISNRLNPVKDVHAQGFGYTGANPVLVLWRAVRNLTYFLLIFAVVIMSFMIMFRVKLSPQTVITVQSALPKIFVALILITFSYAIAGFLIDMVYVVIGLITGILTGAGLTTFTWDQLFGAFTDDRSVLSLMVYFFIWFVIIFLIAVLSSWGGALMVLGLIGIGATVPGSAGVMGIIALILLIVLLIVLLILTFKIWFMLIKTFVNILLLIIIAPIQILLGVFGFGGFGVWVRNMLANLAVYPVVGVMFFMAFLFLAGGFPDSIPNMAWLRDAFTSFMPLNVNTAVLEGEGWRPPLTWGTSDTDLLWVAVSIIIITLIPKTADMIKSMIQGRPFAYGTAIGEAFAIPVYGAKAVGHGAIGWGARAPYGAGPIGDWVSRHPRVRGFVDRPIISGAAKAVENQADKGGIFR
jgi:hypothetical protein